MHFSDARDFFKDVTKFLIEEQNFLLEQFILAGSWHLANPSQENVDISGVSRLDELSEKRSWHVPLFDDFCVD